MTRGYVKNRRHSSRARKRRNLDISIDHAGACSRATSARRGGVRRRTLTPQLFGGRCMIVRFRLLSKRKDVAGSKALRVSEERHCKRRLRATLCRWPVNLCRQSYRAAPNRGARMRSGEFDARCSCHRSCGFGPCLARAGCSARRNAQYRELVPANGRQQLGATEDGFGRVDIAVVRLTTVATHPTPYMQPVDATRSG
jgi:hypothetical protein